MTTREASRTTKCLSNEEHRWHKTCLDRAIRSGDPRKISNTVKENFAEWENAGFTYPAICDDWHQWGCARQDAALAALDAAQAHTDAITEGWRANPATPMPIAEWEYAHRQETDARLAYLRSVDY